MNTDYPAYPITDASDSYEKETGRRAYTWNAEAHVWERKEEYIAWMESRAIPTDVFNILAKVFCGKELKGGK